VTRWRAPCRVLPSISANVLQIRLNWAGKPLRTFETMLGYIRDTITATGLQVTASLVEGVYQTGKRVADAVMRTPCMEPHAVYPPWNYTIRPRADGGLVT
jgi:Rhodopirellula transposase DDE domain